MNDFIQWTYDAIPWAVVLVGAMLALGQVEAYLDKR